MDYNPDIKISIVDVIQEDHRFLQKVLLALSKESKPSKKRLDLLQMFYNAFRAHMLAEEGSVYQTVHRFPELKSIVDVSSIEHKTAEALIESVASTRNNDVFKAKIEVLRELIDHHFGEEEAQILPLLDRKLNARALDALAFRYAELVTNHYQGLAKKRHPLLASELEATTLPSYFRDKVSYRGGFLQEMLLNLRAVTKAPKDTRRP